MLANGAVANLSGINTGDQTTITGNAGTATSLQTGRTISMTGDVTYTSPSFDGTANVTNTSTVIAINNTSLAGLATGILKNTNGTGVPSIAVSGTDYAPATSGSSILKANGGGFSNAAAGTDYVAPSAYASSNGLTMNTTRLLGRTTAAAGSAEEISVAGNLTLSGGVLTGTGLTNPMTTIGDIIYGGTGGTPTRLGAGSTGEALISQGAGVPPAWTALGGSGSTLSGTNTYTGTAVGGRTTTGTDNSAFGYNALGSNTTAGGNTAVGRGALAVQSFAVGSSTYNTAVGYQALNSNQPTGTTDGKWNTAMGYNAGFANTTGAYNTFIGSLAGQTSGAAVQFSTAIGYNAQVTASNTMVFGSIIADGGATVGWGFGVQPGAAAIRVGNAATNGNGATLTLAGTWTNASDSTKKYNIKSLSYGLREIMRLKPINYQWKGSDQQDFGFLAQEVKTILPEIVYGEEGQMTLSYGHITAVLTKAMQEQQMEIEELKAKLKEKDEKVSTLEGSVNSMKDELDNIKRVLGMQPNVKASSKK